MNLKQNLQLNITEKNIWHVLKIQVRIKYPLNFWRFYENSNWPHTSLLCLYPQEKTQLNLDKSPRQERKNVCVLKCRMNFLLRSREWSLFRLLLQRTLLMRKKSVCHCLWSKTLMSLKSCVCSRPSWLMQTLLTSGLIILNQNALEHIRYRFICQVSSYLVILH